MRYPRDFGTRQSGKYRILIIAAIVCTALFMVSPSAATPPSAMSVSFDGTSKELTVSITHATINPQVHYIREVTIQINGQTANDVFYTSQPTKDTFTYTFPLQPAPGDTVGVTATCSLTGSTTRTLIVPGGTGVTALGQGTSPPVTQKAAMEVLPVAGLFLVILVRRA